MLRTTLLALALASPLVLVAPPAAAANCDGDPMYWNPEFPDYYVCKGVVEGDWSGFDAFVQDTAGGALALAFLARDVAIREANAWITCATGGPCPQ